MSEFATDSHQQQRLSFLSKTENRDAFTAEVVNNRLNIVSLLEAYDSVDLPLAVLLDSVE